MSTYKSSSTCLPTGSTWKYRVEVPTDMIRDNPAVPVTDSDMDKLRISARIHAESLSLLGQ